MEVLRCILDYFKNQSEYTLPACAHELPDEVLLASRFAPSSHCLVVYHESSVVTCFQKSLHVPVIRIKSFKT